MDWDGLSSYIALVTPYLRLQDYEIQIKDISGDVTDETVARVEVIPGYYNVVIEIAERFWEENADDQKRTIIHELMHVHETVLSRHFRFIEDHINTPTYHVFMESVKVSREELTDNMARMVLPMLPPLKLKRDD